MKASQVIQGLQEAIEQIGDLDVYYVSQRGWVTETLSVGTYPGDTNWEDAPEMPFIGIE